MVLIYLLKVVIVRNDFLLACKTLFSNCFILFSCDSLSYNEIDRRISSSGILVDWDYDKTMRKIGFYRADSIERREIYFPNLFFSLLNLV